MSKRFWTVLWVAVPSLVAAEPLQAPPADVPLAPMFRADLRPAQRDPFGLTPPAAVAPMPLPEVLPPVTVAAPIEPVAPPPVLTFAGRMRAADGRWLVVAQMGEGAAPVTLEVGKELANGYRVERISDHVVELLNPQTQNMMQMALPAAPRFETW
ncbi:MAG: hypothetical protein AB7S86_05815 [Hydrogenophaga sp.]|uniref:hypothetical protein n=1 Tax=Hydrogenophaga sp. TaxID=1904254 RepID=UPI003D116A9D